jgi:hypothetical protein
VRSLEDRLLIEGLRELAPDVSRTGVKILLEPLTRKETHYMNLQGHGARIIEAVGKPGFALLSDFYHMQMEEDDISGTPGRSPSTTGLASGRSRAIATRAGSPWSPARPTAPRQLSSGQGSTSSGSGRRPELTAR